MSARADRTSTGSGRRSSPDGARDDETRPAAIEGALGTVRHDDARSRSPRRTLLTFLAVLGPGLIVMAGDNDAGAFGTYAQAGQNYGTSLLWTLVLLVPVLYVNQEMALRLGAVSGVGHARLILARFGRFWGAFSVIDLLILNALTIVTEFIGIALALDYFGIPKIVGVAAAAGLVIAGAMQGSFRRFERFCLFLCAGSLVLIPLVVIVHAPVGATVRGLIVPGLPRGADLGTVMLVICGIVGTTVAPWQLFFQQSYVIDKRITARFIAFERVDLAAGIAVVLAGAVAIVSVAAATFAGRPEFGEFADAGAVATGIAKYAGAWPAGCFAIALLDAAVIGAAAVSLSTAYAVGDVLGLDPSLHRNVSSAPAFYASYALLVAGAAALVLVPGAPLGLLTMGVQVLAGVMLPSATVFLLLLSNDRHVLGPWTNGPAGNVFTSVVVAVLVTLSLVLTAATLFPAFGASQIAWTLGAGLLAALLLGTCFALVRPPHIAAVSRDEKAAWRMPSLATLPPLQLSPLDRAWLAILRSYLVVAVALVILKLARTATGRG